MDNKSVNNDEITLKELFQKGKELWKYLFSQWKIILISVIIGSSLGLVYAFNKKTIYTATLSFALEDDKGSGGGGLGLLAGSFGIDLGSGGGSVFTGSNLTELFKSRVMVEKTLLSPVVVEGKVISLAEMYIQNNKWRNSWKINTKFKNIQFLPNVQRSKYFTREHDSILGIIYKNLSAGSLSVGQRDKKNSIISIDVISNDELFSLYFCEGLAKQVGKFYVDTKSKKARMNMEILKHQTDSIRAELNGAITGVAIANDNTFNLNPALNIRRTPSAKRQVDVQANTAILSELVKQFELAKVALRKETPLIQVVDRPILPLPKERFGKTKGLVIGGFLAGFLVVFSLIFIRIFKEITK